MATLKTCKGYNKKCGNKAKREGLCSNCLGEKFRNEIEVKFKKIWDIIPEKEIYINGTKCDIYIEKRILEKVNIRFYIECKDIKRGVYVDKINEFIYNFVALKYANIVDMGIFISRFGFSPSAKDRAKLYNLTTFSIEDLEYIHEKKVKEEWSFEVRSLIGLDQSKPKPATSAKGE